MGFIHLILYIEKTALVVDWSELDLLLYYYIIFIIISCCEEILAARRKPR